MSNQSRDYKKTIAIQMDLNWDGDPTLELEEETTNKTHLDADKSKDKLNGDADRQ